MVQGKINSGRHIDHPTWRHSIRIREKTLEFSSTVLPAPSPSINQSTRHKHQQGNRRSHFTRTVHSHHPLPSRCHLQRMLQRRNDPFCWTMSLAIEWCLMQQTRYNALSTGRKTPKTAPSTWKGAVQHTGLPLGKGQSSVLAEEDQATAIGNMHRKTGKDCKCSSKDILTDRQTYSSQYFTTAPVGKVISDKLQAEWQTLTPYTPGTHEAAVDRWMSIHRTCTLCTRCGKDYQTESSVGRGPAAVLDWTIFSDNQLISLHPHHQAWQTQK